MTKINEGGFYESVKYNGYFVWDCGVMSSPRKKEEEGMKINAETISVVNTYNKSLKSLYEISI